MKKYVAILLIALLVLGGCSGAQVEDIDVGGDVVTVDPETSKPVEQDPDVNAPQTNEPENKEPENKEPENKEPENTPSGNSESGNKTPQNTEPENKEPETTTPGTQDTVDETDDEDAPKWTTSCMSFNVLEQNSGGTTYAHPSVRAPWILETITMYDPDLLGCQEVTKGTGSTENYDMYTYLTTNLVKKGYDVSGLMDSKGKKGSKVAIENYHIGSGLLIFWKRDRFELKDSGAMVYSNDANRHYQWVKLYDKKEKIDILMTNTHLSIPPKVGENYDIAKGHELRAVQGNVLHEFWQKNCPEGTALYATGDYNCDPTTKAFENMTKERFVSSRDYSQNANANSSIDHVMINGDLQDCYEYHRCNETFEPKGVTKGNPDKRNIDYCASDHYAVIAYCSNAYR